MATKSAVFAALKLLGRAFAGTVDEPKADVYHAALEDLSDEELARATTIVIKTHPGEFIPPPAVLRKAVAPARTVVDSDSLLRRIEKLAIYNPASGMIYPAIAKVRDELGERVAYAYTAAGGPTRVFSDDDTTRSIARHEFDRAMREAIDRTPEALPVVDTRALPAVSRESTRELVAETAKSLSAAGARRRGRADETSTGRAPLRPGT